MPPLLAKAITSIIRAGLQMLAGYLVVHGIWTQDAATTYVQASALALATVGWSIYQKYAARLKLLTALTLPAGATENTVDRVVAKGEAPSVTTPKDEPPASTPPAP